MTFFDPPILLPLTHTYLRRVIFTCFGVRVRSFLVQNSVSTLFVILLGPGAQFGGQLTARFPPQDVGTQFVPQVLKEQKINKQIKNAGTRIG